MQENVTVGRSAITGTLKYLSSGDLVTTWGAGNFIALKFSGGIFDKASSIKVGLDPSQGSGLVEIIDDPDRNGAFKITDKDNQKFVVESVVDGETIRQEYDLSGLTCLSYPTSEEITIALSQQNTLFNSRLDGDNVDPEDYDSVSSDDDAYYKTNPEYANAVEEFENTMNGTE